MHVSGPDQPELLSQLTAAFNSLDIIVLSANASSDGKGHMSGFFTITDQDDKKVCSSPNRMLQVICSFCNPLQAWSLCRSLHNSLSSLTDGHPASNGLLLA